jgi:hypothetical protein
MGVEVSADSTGRFRPLSEVEAKAFVGTELLAALVAVAGMLSSGVKRERISSSSCP